MNLYQIHKDGLQSILSPTDKYVFLAGAGISMEPPSNLPSAREFIKSLIEHFAPPRDVDALLNLKGMRYELVIDKLYDNFDKKLRFLDYLEMIKNPNIIHFFLAYSSLANHNVITTNFDYLIEYALEKIISPKKRQDILPVITKKDFITIQEVLKEKNQKSIIRNKYRIYKIHGSKKNIITNEITSDSLITTLTDLGKNRESGQTFTLEPYKKSVVNNLMAGRTLIVMGYSGSDDFDIGPTLTQFKEFQRIIWIEHENTESPEMSFMNPIGDKTDLNKLQGLDNLLAQIRLNGNFEIVLVKANTKKLVEEVLWKIILPKALLPDVHTEPLGDIIDFKQWICGEFIDPKIGNKYSFSQTIFHMLGALESLKESTEQGVMSEDPYAKGLSYRNLSRYYFYKANYLKAIEYCDVSIKILGDIGEFNPLAWSLSDQAQNYAAIFKNELALSYFQKAFEANEYVKDITTKEEQKAGLLSTIGSFYTQIGKFNEALNALKEALTLNEKCGLLLVKANCYKNIADVYMLTQKYDLAKENCQEGLRIAEQLADHKMIGLISSLLANALYKKGQFEAGIIVLENAIKHYETFDYFLGMAENYKEIGLYYFKIKKDVQKALELFSKALDFVDKTEDISTRVIIMLLIGRAQGLIEGRNKALEIFNNALSFIEQLDEVAMKGILYSRLGDTFLDIGDKSSARFYFENALMILKQHNLKIWIDHLQKKLMSL